MIISKPPVGGVPIIPPPRKSQFKYICAIDFGTTRSAFAFTRVDETKIAFGQKSAVEIQAKYLSTLEDKNLTEVEKAPTIIVWRNPESVPDYFDEPPEVMIGGEALRAASEQIDGDEDDVFMCSDFKMLLDVVERRKQEGDVKLKNTRVKLTSVKTGRQIDKPLQDVITVYLFEAARIAFERLCAAYDVELDYHDVMWVITVPAIWTDQARIFMREAAIRAKLGKPGDTFSKNISICLEPEGATLDCFAQAWFCDKEKVNNIKDTKFIVVDIGGGTSDITVSRVDSFSVINQIIGLVELDPPSGGPWGGRLINKRILDVLICPLLGDSLFQRLMEDSMSIALFNMAIIDPIKRNFPRAILRSGTIIQAQRGRGGGVTLARSDHDSHKQKIPLSDLLVKLPDLTAAEIRAGIERINANCEGESQHVVYKEEQKALYIPESFLEKFIFDPVISLTCDHVTTLIEKFSPSCLFLVGGMGANKHVQRRISEVCSKHHVEFIVSQEPSTSIVKGAVRFGIDDKSFGVRLARTNYGLALYNAKDPSKSLFSLMIEKGRSLKEVANKTRDNPLGPYSPVSESQSSVSVRFYETNRITDYVVDEGVYLVAEMEIPCNMLVPFEERRYFLTLNMDGTVMTATFTDQSNDESFAVRWSSR